MSALLGAIEAGGTKFVCAASNRGEILAQTRIPTRGPDATLAAAQQFFEAVMAEHGELSALGIAAFGPLDLRETSPTFGRLLGTPKHGWAGTDLVAPFARRFGCPVVIDTDVNAAALAETLHGAARGCRTAVYVTVGTGIGGGVVVDGRSLRGSPHPEMGHIRVARHERDTAFAGVCPFHGDCLEGLASGAAIRARWGRAAEELYGDEAVWDLVAEYLALGVVNVVCALSPQRVVIGGGVLEAPGLIERIRARTPALLAGYISAPAVTDEIDRYIVVPGLGRLAGVAGALVLAERAAVAALERAL